MTLNYQDMSQLTPTELLKIFTTLPDKFAIDQLFDTEDKKTFTGPP